MPGTRSAIVIGAGTTGLLAAGALARHFTSVTVLERDRLPATPMWRRGSPQSPHVHVLLQRGADVMEQIFPGVLDDVQARGGHRLDMSADTAWHYAGDWKQRLPTTLTMHSQTKGLLEFALRSHLVRIAHVNIRDRANVTGYLGTCPNVTGVQIARDEPLHADLIVDASGRHSKTPGLLADAGFGKLEESAVPVDVGYATALLELPPVPRPWKTLLVHPKYPHTRLGVLLPVEGTNRWLATLVGWRGDHPSDDYEQFLAFARSLAVPDFFSAIQPGKLIGRVFRYRFTGNVRRHYESLSPAPEGLVVIGDAASSFNPIYAQGMSQGATGAALLNQSLERYPAGLAGFARVFQKRYARFMSQCWLMSTTEEFRDHNAFANAPRWTRAANWYLDRVHECTWHDPAVARRFLEVMHLQRHPVALASPGMMRRVLWRPHSAEPTQETAHVAE